MHIFQLCTRFCFFGAFAKAASCSHPRLINFPEQKSFWNVTRPCDLTNGGGSHKGFTQNLATYDRSRCKSDWWGHDGVCQLCSRMPLSTILPWGITRFRFCHIIFINMEPFEPTHRPVDVFNMCVTFFYQTGIIWFLKDTFPASLSATKWPGIQYKVIMWSYNNFL